MKDHANEEKLDRDLLLFLIDKTFEWKLCRMIMLCRILKWRSDWKSHLLSPELQDTDDSLLKEGLMLDLMQTEWEVAEALSGVGESLLRGRKQIAKTLIEYKTSEAWSFIDRIPTLKEPDIALVLGLAENSAEMTTARENLTTLRHFMQTYYDAVRKAKHGGVTVIGGQGLAQKADEKAENVAAFVSLVDYDSAKVVITFAPFAELEKVGEALWGLYDRMIGARVPGIDSKLSVRYKRLAKGAREFRVGPDRGTAP